jgi:endonuclease-8
MPEGDTIYRTARALHKALAGCVVTRFETGLAKLARVNDDAPLTGRTVEKVEARGKWCLIFFSGDLILATHMLMSGSWHVYRPGEKWQRPRAQMRVVIECAQMLAVAFNVPVAEFFTARQLERSPSIPQLGPDVLAAAFTLEAGVRALQDFAAHEPEAEVGNALLNQRVMAGLGNVYKSEVAFAAGVHPFRSMRTLTPREREKLVEFALRYMKANIAEGSGEAIVTYAGNRRTTSSMNEGERLWVYKRAGQQCRRCGATIETRKQGTGARVTFWCPECQKYRE